MFVITKEKLIKDIPLDSNNNGPLAHLGERRFCKAEVKSSSLLWSTNSERNKNEVLASSIYVYA